MSALIIWGTDFRSKKRMPVTPQQELEKMACELMDVIWNPHDRAIYESSLGYIAPDRDPA